MLFLLTNKGKEIPTLNTSPINDSNLNLYMGDKKAKNEIFLAFDYSCPHCHRWIKELFPTIKKWTKEGKVKFRTQSMVFLDENSLSLAKFDQNVKRNYPDLYYDIFQSLISDSNQTSGGVRLSIEQTIVTYNLDREKVISESKVDPNIISKKYTEALHINSVPLVVVNGHKIDSPFSIEEIKSYFH